MPVKEKIVSKLYYTIGEVAELFSVTTSLIRFWEKEFNCIRPKRNKKGNRLFTSDDIENFRFIYHYAKERGYTLEGVKKKLRENRTDATRTVEIVRILTQVRDFLVELKKHLN